MKTLAAILLIACVVAGITALPHVLDTHWWDYLFYAPLAGVIALAAAYGGAIYWDKRP